jgi:hypothetical protein
MALSETLSARSAVAIDNSLGPKTPIFRYRCPWCSRATTTSSTPESAKCHKTGELAYVVSCSDPQCGRASLILVSGHGRGVNAIAPAARPTYSPEGVPPGIAADFQEALGCQASGYQYGAALVGRRVLQVVVRELGAPESSLKKEIDSVPDEKLPARFKQAAHQVRLVGNDAAHADQVSVEQVEHLLRFVGQVLEYVYVMPAQLDTASTDGA